MTTRALMGMAACALMISCTGGETTTTDTAVQASQTTQPQSMQAAIPLGANPTPEEMERQRFDEQWRNLQSFKMRQAAATQPSEAAGGAADVGVQIQPRDQNSAKSDVIDADLSDRPVFLPLKGDVSGGSVLRVQSLLDRVGFSPGIIDGRWGKNTEIAVYWFQEQNGLAPTGEVDDAIFRVLRSKGGSAPPLQQRTLTSDDVKGPFVTIPEDVYEKAKLDCLCYESLGEKIAEMFHTTRDVLEKLNPGVNLDGLTAGTAITGPNVPPRLTKDEQSGIAKIIVSVDGNYLHATDGSGRILFHAPTTVGSKYDPSPNETTKLVGVAFDPEFHYQPTLFHEVPDEEPEAMLKPGPNSPVGVAWMELKKPHYGIHGTSAPETIGYASSHGCIRLTNWDANELGHKVSPGIPVEFIDTRQGSAAGPSGSGGNSSPGN